jgi:APA family basic amino acid/polyamine antiporter
MLNLPVITWVRFLIWMVVGLVLYFAYGMRPANLPAQTRPETRSEVAGPST